MLKIEKVYNMLKNRAKRKGMDFDLTKAYLGELTQPISCPLLQIPIDYTGRGDKDNAPSIDRIDSTKGYVQGNIQVISLKANKMKSNASAQELKRFAESITGK